VALAGKVGIWVRRGGFAVADQGLVSSSNFVASILLARWLDADQYGAFALVFALFLLLSMLYQCLLLEPMSVFGGGPYRAELRSYLRSLLWIHAAISVAVFLILGGMAGATQWRHDGGGLPGALAGMSFAAPCILLFWLARRGCYLITSPAAAATGALLYCVLVIAGFWLAWRANWLSPLIAFLVIGIAALLTGCALLAWLARSLDPGLAGPAIQVTWARHWQYGRWALGGSIASWVPAYIFFPVLGKLSGLASAGDLKALMNIAAPLTQVQAAFSMLLLPYAARARGEGRKEKLARLTRLLTLAGLGGCIAYWALVLLLKNSVFQLLYKGKYLGVADLLPLVAIGSILWGGTFGCSLVLRAMERPRLIFLAYGAAAAASLAIGLPAVRVYGLSGAIWGMNVSDAAAFVLLFWMLTKAAGGNASASAAVEKTGFREGDNA